MPLCQTKTNCPIPWIEIYPSDSTIHLLNNWCLEIRIPGNKRSPQQIVNKYFSCKLSDDRLTIICNSNNEQDLKLTYAHFETKIAEKLNPFGRQGKSLYREVSLPTLGGRNARDMMTSVVQLPLRPKMQAWKSSAVDSLVWVRFPHSPIHSFCTHVSTVFR